jgi:hypothetical protein
VFVPLSLGVKRFAAKEAMGWNGKVDGAASPSKGDGAAIAVQVLQLSSEWLV